MKKSIFRILALCLMAAMVMPLLISCGADKVNNDEETDTSAKATDDNITDAPDAGDTNETTEKTDGADADKETSDVTENDTAADTEKEEKQKYSLLEGKKAIPNGSAYVIRDLSYGSRVDLSTKASKASSQVFDLYLPDIPEKVSPDTPVFIYVHGGGWNNIDYTKDTDSQWLCLELAEAGMLVFSMNYALVGSGNDVSAEDMMSDIDLMFSCARAVLSELGVKADSCGIGGASAGGHLSSLYAYKYGEKAPIKIAFEANIVGPVDMTSYKAVLDSYIKAAGSFEAIPSSLVKEVSDTFGSMVDMKLTSEEDFDELWKRMETISPVNYVTKDSCPSILLYGLRDYKSGDALPADVKSDGMVAYSCYEKIEAKLKENGVPYTAKVFEGYGHEDIPWKAPVNSWIKEQILSYADTYLG